MRKRQRQPGRRPSDARGRDGSGAAPSQGAALMASSQRKLQEERKGPQTLSVALLTPGLWISSLQNVRQVLLVYATQFVILCVRSSRKLAQGPEEESGELDRETFV